MMLGIAHGSYSCLEKTRRSFCIRLTSLIALVTCSGLAYMRGIGQIYFPYVQLSEWIVKEDVLVQARAQEVSNELFLVAGVPGWPGVKGQLKHSWDFLLSSFTQPCRIDLQSHGFAAQKKNVRPYRVAADTKSQVCC